MTGETIVVRPDPEACTLTAAEEIASVLVEVVAQRGVVHWATTGGSTPASIYRHLAGPPLRDAVPWERVQLWWGDDRFVPADHKLSNVHVATSDLLDVGALSGQSGTGGSGADVGAGRTAGAPIPADNIHAVPAGQAIGLGEGPAWAAERYAAELVSHGPPFTDGVPAFDLVLIGMGPDGHVLSVFPNSPTFDAREPVLDVPAPTHVEPHVARVTLHPRILEVAARVIVVAHGAAKAGTIADVFGEERDERRWPAQLARRAGATWILDEAAAAGLPR
ncbi:MAG TPA: 6-phosphogluconolactonase [Candidatus Limnocylindrales bacterium]|nr:6-phosphogluconolactonase [Candidatus Limnocylindrales bacterium]